MLVHSGCRLVSLTLLSTLLIACGSQKTRTPEKDGPPVQQIKVSDIPDAVPETLPLSKYGNPPFYEVFGQRYYVMPSSRGYKERGIASWYGSKFHGRRTSSGEPYDMHAMTAAHKSLPLPTFVKVTNLQNGRQVILKVNDRGPFHDNRIIDLSYTAAAKLNIVSAGTGLVEIEAIDPEQWTDKQTTAAVNTFKSQQHDYTLPAVKLYIQLGAFLSVQNAHKLKNRINTSFNPIQAKVTLLEKDQQHFYRVRIGPIETVEAADELIQLLHQKSFNSARIVID